MKKIKTMVLLSLLLIVGGQMMGQTRAAMLIGASMPWKDFAEFDGFNEFALSSENAVYGGAGVGFNVGLKWYFNVGVKGLDIMLSVDGLYNGPNETLKTAYRNKEGGFVNEYVEGSFIYNSTPKYLNVPAMLGVNYMYYFNPQFAVYFEAGAGGNLHLITKKETVGEMIISEVETKVRTIQDYDATFSFAYQAGLGIEVAKNLIIGCSYYNLGSAPVKGQEVIRRTILSESTTKVESNYRTFGTVQPIMFLGRIGFRF